MARRRLGGAVLVIVAVLALAACGDDDDDVAADGGSEPAGAGAEPAGGGGSGSSSSPGSGSPGSGSGPDGAGASSGNDDSVSNDASDQSQAQVEQGVAGTVTDGDGGPVAGALVTPTSLDDPAPAIPEMAVLTDDEGRYGWTLPAGRYRLTVTADGYADASAEVKVPEDGVAVLDLELAKR